MDLVEHAAERGGEDRSRLLCHESTLRLHVVVVYCMRGKE
jgi:hypothetical protein